MVFPAVDTAVVLQPRKLPLDFPTPAVAAQWPSILSSLSPASIGHNEFNALLLAQAEWDDRMVRCPAPDPWANKQQDTQNDCFP
jgi:hypothetical protein